MEVENRAEKQNMTVDCEVTLVRNDKTGQNEKISSISGGTGCGIKDCGGNGVQNSIRDNLSNQHREILREHRLELVVNEQLLARLVCTPDDLENLAVGRLITEGIIADTEEIEQLYLCESGNRARIFLKKDIRLEAVRMEEPTCCTDNRVFLQAVKMTSVGGAQESTGQVKMLQERPDGEEAAQEQTAVWKKEWIFSIVKVFSEDSKLHRSTGGTHSCLLAMEDRVLYVAEDLGRHNAMDKAIGYAAMQGLDRDKCILFTTGRVPTDMVRKAVVARIPVLVSKAVPTAEAVEMARESGLTLICRAWPDSFEIYAGEV